MYVVIQPAGAITFRLRLPHQWQTRDSDNRSIWSSRAIACSRRESLIDAKRAIARGISPAIEKQREKRRLKEAKSFGEFGERWLHSGTMADSTRAMRRSIFERDILPSLPQSAANRDHARTTCGLICAQGEERGAPATAIHVRDIVKLDLWRSRFLHGEKVANPADEVGPASIATFRAARIARCRRPRSVSCSSRSSTCRRCRRSGSA